MYYAWRNYVSSDCVTMQRTECFREASFILCWMEDRNIAYSLWNKLQGDGWQVRLPRCIQKSPEAEDKLYQIKVVRNDAGRKVKVHYGTEHDEWKDEETETLSPPTEGRLHLEYTYHITVWQFYSSASKQIGRKLDDWNPTNRVFSELQYLAVFKYCLHVLICSTELELKRLTFDPPLSTVLKKFPALMTIGRKLEGRMLVILVSFWSK